MISPKIPFLVNDQAEIYIFLYPKPSFPITPVVIKHKELIGIIYESKDMSTCLRRTKGRVGRGDGSADAEVGVRILRTWKRHSH